MMGLRGTRARRIAWLLLAIVLALAALRLWPKPALREQASYSSAFYSSDGALLRLTLARDEQYRVWTPIEQIDPRLIEAVQLYEDRWFAWHPGVNPASSSSPEVAVSNDACAKSGAPAALAISVRFIAMRTVLSRRVAVASDTLAITL